MPARPNSNMWWNWSRFDQHIYPSIYLLLLNNLKKESFSVGKNKHVWYESIFNHKSTYERAYINIKHAKIIIVLSFNKQKKNNNDYCAKYYLHTWLIWRSFDYFSGLLNKHEIDENRVICVTYMTFSVCNSVKVVTNTGN